MICLILMSCTFSSLLNVMRWWTKKEQGTNPHTPQPTPIKLQEPCKILLGTSSFQRPAGEKSKINEHVRCESRTVSRKYVHRTCTSIRTVRMSASRIMLCSIWTHMQAERAREEVTAAAGSNQPAQSSKLPHDQCMNAIDKISVQAALLR